MTDTPPPHDGPEARPGTPNPAPAAAPSPAPTPTPSPAPTPSTLARDVPAEQWKRDLAEASAAPAAERHTAISALLDDLDSRVGSL